MSKLVLGTVQFGVNYGINNTTGQVPLNEVVEILKIAAKSGIKTLDTSSGYGESEMVLGKAMQESGTHFQLVSKYPSSTVGVKETFGESLKKLGIDAIYGYMVHHFDFYQQYPDIYDVMKDLKVQGKIKKIGFSLYNVEQLQTLLDNNVEIDILQFPYNMLDRQFEPYMSILKEKDVEIHTRSAFLQGLFFKEIGNLPERLKPLYGELKQLHDYANKKGVPMEQLALSFVYGNPLVDGVLIGVDNHNQLEANIKAVSNPLTEADYETIRSVEVKEKELLNPVNWN